MKIERHSFLGVSEVKECTLSKSLRIYENFNPNPYFFFRYAPNKILLIFCYCLLKVRFTQKMLVKLSHHHSSEPFFAPGLLFPVNGMNINDKMSIFSFFCISQINLLKLIQICTHVIINNFIALQALYIIKLTHKICTF